MAISRKPRKLKRTKPIAKQEKPKLAKRPVVKKGAKIGANYFSAGAPRSLRGMNKDKDKLIQEKLVQKASKTPTMHLYEDILEYNRKPPRNAFARKAFDVTVNEFFKRADCEEYYQGIKDSFMSVGINHPDILHFYIRAFLGFYIPRRRICSDHVAPFSFISDMFFEQVRNSIAFANRNGGKTLDIAILNHLDMAFKSHCEICSAGSTIAQSSRMYKYFTGFHNNNQYLADLLFKDPTKSESVYKNGSSIETITGSVKGLNSPHPQKARIDEVELMEWHVLQEGLSMAKSGKGIMAQMCFSCMTIDTKIRGPNPRHPRVKRFKVYTVEDLLVRKKYGKKTIVYCRDIENNEWATSEVEDVWKVGRKKVYSLILKNYSVGGDQRYAREYRELKLTGDQLVMRNNGEWARVDELQHREKLMSHPIINYHNVSRKYARTRTKYLEKRKAFKMQYYVKRVTEIGRQDVYDIKVKDHHNFVAQGIVLHNSTRKEEYGTMQRLLNRARNDKRVKGGFKIYKWCIWEILEKCVRDCNNDPEYGLCPILDVCKGKAKKCTGFYEIDDFIDKAMTLDKDTLDTQWFNKKPSSEVYVYGKYWVPEKHVLPMHRNEKFTTIEWLLKNKEIEKIGAIDFGSSPGHPFVYKLYFCDVRDFKREVEVSDEEDIIRSKITFYVAYEYRSGQATIAEHAQKIRNSPFWSPEIPVFADPSARQERIDLEAEGVYTYAADNELLAGIDKVRAHLQLLNGRANLYYVDGYYNCDDGLEDSTEEYKKYKYRRTRDGHVNNKEPLPIHDHGPDCDRYAIASSVFYFREMFSSMVEEISGGFWA